MIKDPDIKDIASAALRIADTLDDILKLLHSVTGKTAARRRFIRIFQTEGQQGGEQ